MRRLFYIINLLATHNQQPRPKQDLNSLLPDKIDEIYQKASTNRTKEFL
jgi:hypothetical protein